MKRIVLLFVWLMGIALQIGAYDFSAKSEGQFQIDLYFSINPDGNTVTVTQGPESYTCNALNIPASVSDGEKTYTVTIIGYQAFMDSKVDAVVMPNTITEIMSHAFRKSSVASVTFSKGLKQIREYAFSGAALTSVELFNGLEIIEQRAFSEENSVRLGTIQTVILPNSVTKIGVWAFQGQRKLSEIRLPENLAEIEQSTFQYCENLKKIELPKGLQKIGEKAFYQSGLQEITFPAKLTEIGDNAFEGNKFTEIILPDNVTTLGKNAFQGCTHMTSITFSAGMSEIPEGVCYSNDQLVNVTLPEGIKKIGTFAFYRCTRLSHITFPESVTEVGQGVFSESGITDFTFPSKLEYASLTMFSDCNNLTTITLPSTVKEIQNSVFRNCRNLKEVILPETLTTISESAFSGCASLLGINLPQTITVIKASAFSNCTSLTNIVLPKGLQKMGGSVFSGCSALAELTIPHETAELGNGCFELSTALTALHYQRAIPPSINTQASNPRLIHDDNNCTLYVPIGSKAAYEAIGAWGAFKEIAEEEVPDVFYRASVTTTGNGSIKINGEKATQQDIKLGSRIVFTIEANEGYHLQTLLCNGKDIMSDISGNEYTIESVSENVSLIATFTDDPVVLQLKSAEGGSMDMLIEKGSQFTCTFTPAENWKINSVHFNYSDVTNEVITNNNRFTTPDIYSASTLSVSFESIPDGIAPINNNSRIQVYSNGDGSLVIEGAKTDESISILTADGKLIKKLRATGEKEVIALQGKGVYLICSANKTIKVCL